MATIMHKLEALEIKERAPVQINQFSTSSCHNCLAPSHVSEECPLLGNNQPLGQVNATFQRYANEQFSPTYNPGWRNHPNFACNQGTHSGTQTLLSLQTNNFLRETQFLSILIHNFNSPICCIKISLLFIKQ